MSLGFVLPTYGIYMCVYLIAICKKLTRITLKTC